MGLKTFPVRHERIINKSAENELVGSRNRLYRCCSQYCSVMLLFLAVKLDFVVT